MEIDFLVVKVGTIDLGFERPINLESQRFVKRKHLLNIQYGQRNMVN